MIRSVLALVCAAFAVAAAAEPYASPTAGWQWGVKVPLRDGVKLNATLYRPAPDVRDAACVFTLTPYISQTYHERGQYFSKNGYVFLTIDVRGRGNSEGRFTPLLQEVDDVRDVVEWLGKQPWCNGKVAMWGGSYAGYNQWLAAKWRQPALRSLAPAAAPWVGYDFPSNSGIYLTYNVMWLTLTSGKTAQDSVFGDMPYWDAKMIEWNAQHRPYAGLDADLGNPSAIFQSWVAHPQRDAYWDRHAPTPADFAKIDLPILSIIGQYDLLTLGGLAFYRAHMRHASDAAKAKHFLVLGPWTHAGTRTPTPKIGEMPLGAAALVDMNALHKAWYDHTLKSGPLPAFLKKRVAYYVLGDGAEEWRYADTLEAVTSGERALYLASDDGRANDLFHSGRLDAEPPPQVSKPDAYVHDPLATPPEDIRYDFRFVTHHSLPMRAHGRHMLVYHGAPLDAPTEIAGQLRLKVWLSLDQPDTDLVAWLYEVKADGSNVMLGFDLMRARYREGTRVSRPVVPGAIEPYVFDEFQFVARRLAQGSRLRLVISPTPRPWFEHNYNTGGIVAHESGKNARTVTVTLHHDRERPSALYLPLAAAKD